jgi:hypothetical protein
VDVYARRWENRGLGRSGFQPACANEWAAGLCDKRRAKCGTCRNRQLLPLTPAVIRDHLRGEREDGSEREFVVGIYPLLADETCCFLAIDFDGPAWQEDAKAVLGACRELAVPAGGPGADIAQDLLQADVPRARAWDGDVAGVDSGVMAPTLS